MQSIYLFGFVYLKCIIDNVLLLLWQLLLNDKLSKSISSEVVTEWKGLLHPKFIGIKAYSLFKSKFSKNLKDCKINSRHLHFKRTRLERFTALVIFVGADVRYHWYHHWYLSFPYIFFHDSTSKVIQIKMTKAIP